MGFVFFSRNFRHTRLVLEHPHCVGSILDLFLVGHDSLIFLTISRDFLVRSGGFLKWGLTHIIYLNRVFHYKPYFRKPPCSKPSQIHFFPPRNDQSFLAKPWPWLASQDSYDPGSLHGGTQWQRLLEKHGARRLDERDLDLEQRDGEAERFGCKMGSQGLTIRVSPPKNSIGGVSANVSQAHFFVLVFRGCDAGFQNGSDRESEAAKPVNIGLVQARHYQRLGPFCQPMKRTWRFFFLDGRRSTLHSQLK